MSISTSFGNVPLSDIDVVSAKKITATIDPADSTPTGPATATVTNSSSSSDPGSATASPAPEILGVRTLYQGADISDQSGTPPNPSFVVGQPITLDTDSEAVASSGIPITSSTWTVGGTNIGGYVPTASSASVTQTDTTQTALNTFWVYPKTGVTVKYKYCVNVPGLTDLCSPDETATFDVAGPTASITPDTYQWYVTPPLTCQNATFQVLSYGLPNPTSGCNFTPLKTGIQFQAAISNVPSSGGTTEWVQLITKDILSGVDFSGTKTKPLSIGVGLDNSYPYKPDDPNDAVITQASDSPNFALDSSLAKETRTFKADIYYLWTSNISGSIPVPLGYVEWKASGTAVQHTANTPSWSLAVS